jgi:hypothetical protein
MRGSGFIRADRPGDSVIGLLRIFEAFRGAPVVSQPSPVQAGKLPVLTRGAMLPLIHDPGSYRGPDGKTPG